MSLDVTEDIAIQPTTTVPLRVGLWMVLLAALCEIVYGVFMYEPSRLWDSSPTLWWAFTWLAVALVFLVDVGVLVTTFARPARRSPLRALARVAAIANIAAYAVVPRMIVTREFDHWPLVNRAYVMTAAWVSLSAWWYWSTLFSPPRVARAMRIVAMLTTFAAVGPQISPPLPMGETGFRGLAEPCIGDLSGLFSAVYSLVHSGFSVSAVIYLICGFAGLVAIAVLGYALLVSLPSAK